jgi:hypothetical protein
MNAMERLTLKIEKCLEMTPPEKKAQVERKLKP